MIEGLAVTATSAAEQYDDAYGVYFAADRLKEVDSEFSCTREWLKREMTSISDSQAALTAFNNAESAFEKQQKSCREVHRKTREAGDKVTELEKDIFSSSSNVK